MPPFSRPVPKEYAWNDPDNPEHTPELRADIEEMARLWRNREASWRDQPWPVENQPIPRALWRRLFRLRNRYHSLEDTLQFKGLRGYSHPHTEGTKNDEHHCSASPDLCAAPENPSVGPEGPKGPQEACEVTRQ